MASYQVTLRGKAVNIVYQNGKQIYLPLAISVAPEHFNTSTENKSYDGRWVKQACANANDYNVIIGERLNELKSFCNRFFLDNKIHPSPESLKGFFKKGAAAQNTFANLWVQFAHYQGHKGSESVSLDRQAQYKLACRYLVEYNNHINIDTIDLAFYHGFKDFLQHKKKCGENRVGAFINILKAFLHWCIENDKTTLQERMVRKFKVKWARRDIVFNTAAELQKLLDVNLVTDADGKALPKDWDQIRDMYLLQALTGMRHSDASRELAWSIHNNMLRLRSQKTNTEITVPLRTEVQYLLSKYSEQRQPFPNIDIHHYNKIIKKIARLAGITQTVVIVHGRKGYKPGQRVDKCELMSTHVARATFICMMVENNIHTRKIMAMTGIKEEKTINHYAAVLQSSLGEEMEQLAQRSPLRITHLKKTA